MNNLIKIFSKIFATMSSYLLIYLLNKLKYYEN